MLEILPDSISLFEALAALAAATSAFMSWRAADTARHQASVARQQLDVVEEQLANARMARRMDIHIRFQTEIRSLWRDSSWAFDDPDWTPTREEMAAIHMYWCIVYDEWVICTQGGEELRTLWDKYYVGGVKAALRVKAFQEAVEDMINSASSFFAQDREFCEVLDQIAREIHGRGLPLA